MRKLRKAALVAAMIGSLSMAGAGVASATDYDKKDGGDDVRQCVQGADQSHESEASGLIAVNLAVENIGLLGNASQQNTQQNICVNGDGSAAFGVQAPEAENGEGGNGLLNLLNGLG
ncbi:hypothetical protein ACFW2D_11815 [Streptomyces sp. NPDC058914]|uniref:hypothetical protein n=1 Tax=Streptomyces TaxID=1883 RepID=UPI003694BD39